MERAKSASGQLTLARSFYKHALEEKDPANRFVLLDRARRRAAAGGNLELAMQAADQLIRSFQCDGNRVRLATLVAASKAADSSSAARAVPRAFRAEAGLSSSR